MNGTEIIGFEMAAGGVLAIISAIRYVRSDTSSVYNMGPAHVAGATSAFAFSMILGELWLVLATHQY